MAQATQTYKRSLSGSVGAGMRSIFGGEGRRFYTLVHKVSSKYHKAGEAQQIIVDEIELGRDPRCQVRFDESFETVSRHHAAIVKDGDNWKLVQLSQTNSTYLNGHKVQKEWYLQNGDEIQLSTNGPKLGFIIPEGKKGLVSSINLTARLNLFRQQALRPYKQALTALSCLLLLGCGFGGYALFKQQDTIGALTTQNTEFTSEISQLKSGREALEREVDSLSKLPPRVERVVIRQSVEDDIPQIINTYKNDILYMEARVLISKDGKMSPAELIVFDENGKPKMDENGEVVNEPYGWSGTAFLLNDGRLVTARHCIQGWRYPSSFSILILQNQVRELGGELVADIVAVSKSGKKYQFTSKDCRLNDRNDQLLSHTFENGASISWKAVNGSDNTDWAYYQTNDKGRLSAASDISTNLAAGTPLHVLGYPLGMGVESIAKINPLYTKVSVSIDGTNGAGNIIHTGGMEHGNSGGPVMICKNNRMLVVGIVSGAAVNAGQMTTKYDIATPIAQIH